MSEGLEKKEAEAMAALSPEDRHALLLLTACLDPSGTREVTVAAVQPDEGPAFICVTEASDVLAALVPTLGGWESIDEQGGVLHSRLTLATLADHLRRRQEEALATTLRNGGWTVQPPHVTP